MVHTLVKNISSIKPQESLQQKNSKEFFCAGLLTGLINGAAQGIGGLLGFAAELERQGESDYEEHGAIEGKTKSGKKIKGAYGFRVKVGLNPEDFMGQKRLNSQRRKK